MEPLLSMVDIGPTLHSEGVSSNSKPQAIAAPRKGNARRKSRYDSSPLRSQPSTPAKSTKRVSKLAPVLSSQHEGSQSPPNQRIELDTTLVKLFSNSSYVTG